MIMIMIHYIFAEIIHPLYFIKRINNEKILIYPFLPLLSLSCIGAIQLLISWYHIFIIIWDCDINQNEQIIINNNDKNE